MMPQSAPAALPIRLLTADDHPLLREGIAAIIEGQPDMELVAEAANGHEAVEYFRTHRPDVTLMDIQMPEMNGIEATLAIRREFPDARIVMLTTYRGDVRALRAIQAGAAGYLLKSMLRKDLLDTVRAVRAGQRRIPGEIAQTLAEHVTHETLSEREIDVLRLVAQGGTNKRVAARLEITEDTVKAHMKNILGKLVATDRTHAVMIALKRGIIDFQ